MSTPRIRFFTGAQGQRIAYATSGSGPPLVLPAWWVSHVERDWANERFQAFFEPLARHHTVVRYDRPGVGLSVRERSEFTLENEVETLASLIEHLGFDRVSFLGFSCGGPPAVTYAARNPARVDRLVLVGSYSFGGALATTKVINALVNLVEAHWGLGAQTIADLFAPDLEKKQTRQIAKSQREWASAELAARLLELSFSMDCRDVALQLSHPTLVMHRRDDRTVPLDAGRDLAARVGNAEFITLEGNAHVPWEGDSAPIVEVALEFLGARTAGVPTATDLAPPTRPEGDHVWCREGGLWRVTFAGQSVHLPHRKGLEDLATLLTNPMREIPAEDLMAGFGERAAMPAGASDEVLDDRARAEYAARARDIEAELAEAEAQHDLGRVEALRSEREALLDEVSRATGLGGRSRRLSDPGERARKALSARIKDSFRCIREVHPDLADHLEAHVTTGSTCAYRPDTERLWRA
jgi:pimeloyl-ACP methyl ester carboxylesterase